MPLKPVVFVPGFPASELLQASNNRTIFPPGLKELADKTKRKRLISLLSAAGEPAGPFSVRLVAHGAGAVRKEVVLKRTGLKERAQGGFVRCHAQISWGGGGAGERREVPFLVQV